MWFLLFLIASALYALPSHNTRVRVCGPDSPVATPMRIATAMEYVRLQPGSCWGECPCPPVESAGCALVATTTPDGRMRLLGAFNSTTFVDAEIWVDGVKVGGAVAEIDSPTEVARATLRALDARYFECEAEIVIGPAAGCPTGQFVCATEDTDVPAAHMGVLFCSNGRPACNAVPRLTVARSLPPDNTCSSLDYECGEYMTDYGTHLKCGTCPEFHKCCEGHCIEVPH